MNKNTKRMYKMTVWYMNGAGNSFAVVDARNVNIDMSDMAKELCQKRNCDGFMALDSSDMADFRLHFYNRDGSRAEMCGNGARCICRFAYDNKIAGKKMTVETDAGIVEGERIEDNIYKIKLNTPKDIALEKQKSISYCVVGVPHIVTEIKVNDFEKTRELFERAQSLRKEFNANVNFYCPINENTVKILTYERGVEDFTKACGTGSGAVAAILFERKIITKNEVTIKNLGGELKVTLAPNGALYLEGKAEIDAKMNNITI
jgi:diaminopimelate epimerase